MNSIETFLRINGLRQVDLARYLGMSEGSVSKMIHGQTNATAATIKRLVENDRGWDATPLTGAPQRDDSQVKYLKAEVKRLRAEVEDLRREKEEYWQVIKNLSVPSSSPDKKTTPVNH